MTDFICFLIKIFSVQGASTRASVPPCSGGGGKGASASQLNFHHDLEPAIRPKIVAIAAGASHTSMLTSTGVVLAFMSVDTEFGIQEVVGALSGKRVVKISAGKTRTVAVTDTGEVYAWEADPEAGASL